MSGAWLAMGAVGLLAAARAVRGSRARWTKQDAFEAGRDWEGANDPWDVTAEELEWRYEPAYSTRSLQHLMPSGNWRGWLEKEAAYRQQQYEKPWLPGFAAWWMSPEAEEEPVVIVEYASGKPEGIWDGWHRVAVSQVYGRPTLPAFVGRRRRRHTSDLDLAVVTEGNLRFETGRPVTFPYLRNTMPSPHFGSEFSQDVEPAGRYMTKRDEEQPAPPDSGRERWETGSVTFDHPLVLWHGPGGELSYGPDGWKARLSRAYGGKTGLALSKALAAEGYDGIVTVQEWRGTPYTSEIVDLTMFEGSANEDWTQILTQDPGFVREHLRDVLMDVSIGRWRPSHDEDEASIYFTHPRLPMHVYYVVEYDDPYEIVVRTPDGDRWNIPLLKRALGGAQTWLTGDSDRDRSAMEAFLGPIFEGTR